MVQWCDRWPRNVVRVRFRLSVLYWSILSEVLALLQGFSPGSLIFSLRKKQPKFGEPQNNSNLSIENKNTSYFF